MSMVALDSDSARPQRTSVPDTALVGLALLGVMAAIPLPGGTSMFLGEPVFALFMFMALRYRAAAYRYRDTALLLILGLLFFFVQILTDIYRSTPSADFTRGWARFAFFYAAFCTFSVLFTTRQRLLVTVCAFSMGAIFATLAMPSAQQVDDPWKFGLATPLTYGSVAAFALLNARRNSYVVLLATLAVVDLILGFRSEGLVSAATAMILFATRGGEGWRAPSRRTLVKLGVAGALAFAVFSYAYVWAASSGRLGVDAQMKYEKQSAGGAGILIGARPELLASLYAIRDSPLVGWGSWPLDTRGYNMRARTTLLRDGYVLLPGRVDDRIPIHSHLFGGWVEGGLVGLIFWIAVLSIACKSLLTVIRRRFSATTPLAILIVISLLWDVLFSPFGAERRVLTALLLAVLIFIRHEQEPSS